MSRAHSRPATDLLQPRLPWTLRSMLIATVLVPLLGLVGAAWLDHRRLTVDAFEDVDRLSAVAKEHALKVVETNALVLDRLDDRIRGLTWPQIEAEGATIQREMRLLDENIAQITSLHLATPEGRVVLLSIAYPTPPLDIGSRGYFRRLTAGEQQVVFGEPVLTRLTGVASFAMARRRTSALGRFDGAVVGSILPSYFQTQ